MKPQARRRVLQLASAALVALSSVSGLVEAAPSPSTHKVQIRHGQVDRTMRLVRVSQGDAVVIEFDTDEAVDLHLHGYDLSRRVLPGTPQRLNFKARLTGRFPIEAHGFGAAPSASGSQGHAPAHRTLLHVEVHPR